MADLNEKTILIIGAGPRIIGQSAECDEGAMEAARTLAGQSCRIITVNSNPDAIMTAPGWAHRSYLEPLTTETLAQIIAVEKPDAILPAFGGRHGLHLAAELASREILHKYKIALWGLSAQSVEQVLNRDTLNAALNQIGLKTPPIFVFDDMEAAIAKAQELGFPVVLRHANANRMPDGALVYNQDELRQHALPGTGERGGTLSIEASLLAWQQVELEILRDHTGKTRIVGGVEYIDTAGIHPGDAVAVCPPQTLTVDLIGQLSAHAVHIADHLKIVGSATIRFACRAPAEGAAVLVLAVHPRYTRSSALVARIAKLPLAGLIGLLAAGCDLDGLPSGFLPPPPLLTASATRTSTPVGVKWPCWDFKQLKATVDRLGPKMQAVGQNVGYGHNFKEALQKAARAAHGDNAGLGASLDFSEFSSEGLAAALSTPSSRRLHMVYEALRRNESVEKLTRKTHIAPWFLNQLKELVDIDQRISNHKGRLPSKELLIQAKKAGFGNEYLAERLQISAQTLVRQMADNKIQPGWQNLSTSNGDLRFSTYGRVAGLPALGGDKKVLIIGSGAYRIGQGPECDYGIYQAIEAVNESGYRPVMLNSNLAGVTTGRAMTAGCYCDPITAEDIHAVLEKETPYGIITQFSGIRSYALSKVLDASGANILGSPQKSLMLVNDRAAFRGRLRELGIPQPAGAIANSGDEALQISAEIGFPVQVRRAHDGPETRSELFRDKAMLAAHLASSDINSHFPLLVEQFLEYAIEAQAEVLGDGEAAHVAAVMEHIELAGVHAGDSSCVLPPYSIPPRHVETITAYCQKIAVALEVKGLLNLRFAIYRDTVYLLEAAFNTCRNLSVVNRVHQLPLAAFATRLMLGATLTQLPLTAATPSLIGVRAAVFPFNVFSAEDPLLGPQMRSIGQVISLADTFGLAYFKAQEAAATPLPTQGTVLITVTDEDKTSILEPARIFHELGFKLMATRGTQSALAANGIEAQVVRKIGFGRPNLLDEIKNGHVQMVINTPTGGQGQIDDSIIRKTAITYHVANMTTPASALAAAKGIAARLHGRDVVRALPATGSSSAGK